MPYIEQDHRPVINAAIVKLPVLMTPGETNYAITRILDRQIEYSGMSYTLCNSLIGALECAKLELYRRMLAPYEDQKCAANGDAYHAQ